MRLKDIDLEVKLADEGEYERRLHKAQLQLLLIQRHMYEHRREALLVFEGWDASGKGGSIRRLVERLDPRGFVVHPIGAPTPEEKSVHFLQRFWTRLPGPGRLGIFDRSWYGRVLVERVEGHASKLEWQRAYGVINDFERAMAEEGAPVVKFFLHISRKEQLKRFKEREANPFKNWKITDEDWRNREKWNEYEEAIDDMLEETSTRHAPWHVVPANHKWYARVAVCEMAVKELSAALDCSPELPRGWRELDQ